MQVILSKELEASIAEKVQNGGYANADEVVREALRDLNWRNCCWPPCVDRLGPSPRNILSNFAPVPEGRRTHDPDGLAGRMFFGTTC